jgi:alcohol dehydrogenase class IV
VREREREREKEPGGMRECTAFPYVFDNREKTAHNEYSGYLKILGLDGAHNAKARSIFTDAIELLRRQTQTQVRD